MRRVLSSLLAFVIILSVIAGMGTALAATTKVPGGGQALEIAPPVIYLTANPGQKITTKILLRDVSSTKLIVSGQANDFVASGEDGTPKLLLDKNENDPYSLKTWVTPPAQLTLVPHEIKTMSVAINVPKNASPGGHYGVIRFTATPPGLEGTGVSLSASLGALILLTVRGNITENLTIKEFSVNKDGKSGSLFESGPLNFAERLENSGNVHLQPTGLVTVKDMFGKQIATLPVNTPPKSILPQSIRKFEQSLDKSVIGKRRLFGRYTAQLNLSYGSPNKTLTASLSFWVIPYKMIALAIVGLIALFFLLRYALRRYNRYIISRGQKKRH
jgi:hypothetical protein